MALSNEMRRLTQHFLEAYDDRMAAVANIRTATTQELAEFDAAHEAMAAELRARLDEQESTRWLQAAEDARERAEYAEGVRSDAAGLLKGFDAAHQAMAAELRADLDEQESGRLARAVEDARERAGYVEGVRSDTAALLKELDAAHQEMATELRGRLEEQELIRLAQAAQDARGRAQYVEGVRSDTATLLKGFGAAQQEMATELRARLEEQESARLAQAADDARARAEYVDGLCSDTGAFLKQLDAAHQAMARDLRQRLGQEQADLREARRVWSSFSTLMEQRRAGKPAAPPPPSPPPVEEVPPGPPAAAPPEVVEEVTPDDLTAIRGIGSGMQQRLNDAGIYTFAQLARTRPSELREMLGDAARLARVEEWIEQASQLGGLG